MLLTTRRDTAGSTFTLREVALLAQCPAQAVGARWMRLMLQIQQERRRLARTRTLTLTLALALALALTLALTLDLTPTPTGAKAAARWRGGPGWRGRRCGRQRGGRRGGQTPRGDWQHRGWQQPCAGADLARPVATARALRQHAAG